MKLPDEELGLKMASLVSEQAQCTRRKVGAVIFDDLGDIASTGFNHSAFRSLSCVSGDCVRAYSTVEPGSDYDSGPGFCIAVHAEADAILKADRNRIKFGIMYVTNEPCGGCQKLISASGINRVIWPGGGIANAAS